MSSDLPAEGECCRNFPVFYRNPKITLLVLFLPFESHSADLAARPLWLTRVLGKQRSAGQLLGNSFRDHPSGFSERHALPQAFDQSYSHYLDNSKHEDTLVVGDRRVLMTIRLEPPFDNPCLFANPCLREVPLALCVRCHRRLRNINTTMAVGSCFLSQASTGYYLQQRLRLESLLLR